MQNKTLVKLFLFIFGFNGCVNLYSQKADSLLKVLQIYQKADTNKVRLLYKTGFFFEQEGNYSSALYYLDQSRELSNRLNFKDAEGLAFNRMGLVYQDMDELNKARDAFTKGLAVFKSAGLQYKTGVSYNSLGNLEETAGNYNAALQNYFYYLDYAEKENSPTDIAIAYNNIAIVYSDMDDYKKELAYNFKALKIREQLNDPLQLAASYNNVGVCYQYVENYISAIPYFNKALDIRKKFKQRKEMAAVYHNLAICYKYTGEDLLAEKYYNEALSIQKNLGLNPDIALTSINLGRFYLDRKDYKKSFDYLKSALAIADEKKLLSYQTDAHRALFDAYELVNQPAKALFHFKKYIDLRDSINNVEKSKEFTRIEMQNKFDKENAVNLANQAKKDAVSRQQQRQQKIITGGVCILLLIVAGFLFFVYRSFRQKKQANIIITLQKKEVESQKHLVEEKQKEIIDSINYAQRIQRAILAREEDIRQIYPQSFLLYKPKDIVAGDFYFFESTADYVFYAAADCTGHGVPGALVSVVCSNALSRCVKEFGLTSPGLILDKTRELVLETFKKSGQDVKDGMDISLFAKETYTNKYSWAGANNPLWYIQDKQLKEIKATKQPIGQSDSPSPFETHELELQPDDSVFLFTDGYADQFGGPKTSGNDDKFGKGKKFKYKQFGEVLLTSVALPPLRQKEKLEEAFEAWKLGYEQVDDVLVIGIKI
ncbi:MAG: tetratricopeptide repeat protein [Bacteroidetes bacterium]|nr:tetratricopeptide repeat protein [Bacteroidota bacterium]